MATLDRIRWLGRQLLLALVRLLYPAPRGLPKPIDRRSIQRILLIRTDPRVGNVLLTTPLLRALRQGFPAARVDFLVAAGKERLVTGLADGEVVFAKKDFFRAPWRFWRLLLRLRAARYDVAVEAGHWHAFSFTAAWLTSWTRARVRIGHRRGLAARFLTHPVDRDPGVLREVPAKLELLGPLGIAPAGEALDTTVDRGVTVPWLESLAGGKALVAINPGARKPSHRWPAEAFGALAARLASELALAPVIVWGPGEEEIARRVAAASRGRAQVAPPTQLPELAAVFRQSALVITNDTGPMHLAVAAGAPVVALQLAEDGARWSHLSEFVGMTCATGSPQEIERALQAAKTLLGANRLASRGGATPLPVPLRSGRSCPERAG